MSEIHEAHGRYYEVRPSSAGGMTAVAVPSPHATEQKLRFLDALVATGSAHDAAEVAGVDRVTMWRWSKEDADFRAAWDIAIGQLVHRGTGTLYQRGLNERGMPGVVAMLAWLKAHDAEHWVERYQQPANGAAVLADALLQAARQSGARAALIVQLPAGEGPAERSPQAGAEPEVVVLPAETLPPAGMDGAHAPIPGDATLNETGNRRDAVPRA